MQTEKKRLIVFVTDSGFLVPAVRAALDAVAQPAVRAIADCIIYVIDPPRDHLARLNETFAEAGIAFAALDSRAFVPDAQQVFYRGHVPLSTLGRLAIGPLLPETYEHILYLDGDIAILGDIHPLVSHDVAPDKIAAASDALWLYENNGWRTWNRYARYLKGLGIADPRTYFNAGVLMSTRRAWVDITHEAREFFLRNSALCVHHDQSALNAVAQGRREWIAPRFNFLTEYAALGFTDDPDIRIVHFTGHKKPWEYTGPPWNGRFLTRWSEVVAAWPILAPNWSPRPPYRTDRDPWTHFKRTVRRWEAAPWRNDSRARMLDKVLSGPGEAVDAGG